MHYFANNAMQARSAHRSRRLILLIILQLVLHPIHSLKCRAEEGPSDAQLKRVARTCMRRVSENSYTPRHSHSGSGSATNTGTSYSSGNKYYGQQQHGQQSNGQHSNNNRNYYAYNEGENEENDSNNNNNNNYRGNNYERVQTTDTLSQRNRDNRDRMQNNHAGRQRRSSAVNSERAASGGGGRFDQSTNSGRHSNGGGNSGSNGSGSNTSNNQRSPNGSGGNSNKNHNGNNNYNTSSHDRDRDHQSDGACVVHCFFEEMNMLNSDDFPDKHKVSYMLTKDLHDRELRSFYVETIQECFHYLETQRRRDKCQFARELINCMTEYAKGNCDDWEDYNIMFN